MVEWREAVRQEPTLSMGRHKRAAWCKQAFSISKVRTYTGGPGGSNRAHLSSLLVEKTDFRGDEIRPLG